jgi:hypothetical protein
MVYMVFDILHLDGRTGWSVQFGRSILAALQRI